MVRTIPSILIAHAMIRLVEITTYLTVSDLSYLPYTLTAYSPHGFPLPKGRALLKPLKIKSLISFNDDVERLNHIWNPLPQLEYCTVYFLLETYTRGLGDVAHASDYWKLHVILGIYIWPYIQNKNYFTALGSRYNSNKFGLTGSISRQLPAATMTRPMTAASAFTYTSTPVQSRRRPDKEAWEPVPSIPKAHMPHSAQIKQVHKLA